ncbi:MAG: methylmalonyl Co-A mutase-associated GTPase MeaB [Desulfobacula sp.]|nr:methylmalonyl Co-A mutase-associated GTPase MeaB [Desulfobacula sp.]
MLKIDDIRSGSHLAGARLIRLIEDNEPSAIELLKSLYANTGKAFIIGITGSPGVGKSTLIDALIFQFRELSKKVAVIAVDPTSPYTGGAILGDRLRMQRHATDPDVFIRSMASRGQTGGLSRAAKDATTVLDAMGFDIIIIETVGAGQAQFDIASLAHCVGIVSIPSSGDGIQAVKAGILETGDIFIVNKSDTPDADLSFIELCGMLEMRQSREFLRTLPPGLPPKTDNGHPTWQPKVLKTIAQDGTGIKELTHTFLSYLDFMKKNNLLKSKQKTQEKLYFKTLLKDLILEKINGFMDESKYVETALNDIQLNITDPISAAQHVVNKTIGHKIKE